LARDQSEKRSQCDELATGIGFGKLFDGLDMASQTPPSDGSTRPGGIGHAHLDYYLDEFTFRFNRRNSKSRGKLFYRLLQQAFQVDPVTYGQIVSGKVDENGTFNWSKLDTKKTKRRRLAIQNR